MRLDIVMCGVGGQGNLLAAIACAEYAIHKGYNVIGTDTIGAAQRGGAVVSHVRISDCAIYSPLVSLGAADVLVGLEPVEALRNIRLLKAGGQFLINVNPVPTVLCNMGLDNYPGTEAILNAVRAKCPNGLAFDATALAGAFGGERMTNVVMLGVLAHMVSFFEKDEFASRIVGMLPETVREAALGAFEAGFERGCPGLRR